MSSEAVRRADPGGQLILEISILRTLCLTINSDGSELKYRILDDLTAGDFYFPVTRKIFEAASELHGNGDQVVAASLQEALARSSIDVPDDFYVEDLFRGELASMATLSEWIDQLRSAGKDAQKREREDSGTSPLAKTHPSVKAASPRPAKPAAPPSPAPAPSPPAARPKPPPAAVREEATEPDAGSERAGRKPGENDLLSPESGQWLGFLAELTRKQGERLKTGFRGLDLEWGGLLPGLFLLAGEDRRLLLDFLKQLVDQIAIECRGPCLYLSFERSKTALRVQTLSRLSGAPAADIERGRFGRDSSTWQDVVRAGEHAVEWLQRIYVVETPPGLSVTRIRELRQHLLDSGAGAPRLVAVDNLEKLANESDLLHSVAELKELAESFGIVVVGAATAMELVHERSADMAATFHDEDGKTVVKLTAARFSEPGLLRLEHRPEIHRFQELAAES